MATQKGRNWSSGDIVTAANLSSVERGVSAVSSLYEPTTWANGDTVTAAALNNIEQGIVNADGGGSSWVTLCEEEVTTEENNGMYSALLSYSQLISADTIRVTFDGNEYICENVSPVTGVYAYGGAGIDGPDFSEYPFAVISGGPSNAGVANQIVTETSGTHTIKIEALQESGSSDFSTAQVTITNNSEINLYLQSAIIYDDMLMLGINLFSNSTNNVTFVVYLAGDPCETMILDHEGGTPISSTDVSVTGGVEVDEDFFLITGDGTITISDSGDTPIST